MSSSHTNRERPQQQRNLTADKSTMAKLKHWFIKGAGIEKDATAVRAFTKPYQQTQVDASDYTASTATTPAYNIDPSRPDLVPPRGLPRRPPRAVRAGGQATRDRRPNEVENESIFSTSTDTQSTGLTSVQSTSPSTQQSRSKPPSDKKSRSGGPGLNISNPFPTQSLLDFASQYDNVQNPQTAYDSTHHRRQPPASSGGITTTKPPLYSHNSSDDRKRHQRFHPDQPVQEVSSGRAHLVLDPPSRHQRSQKTVVRKAPLSPPLATRRTPAADGDDNRHMSHVTLFEDFMGRKDTEPLPPMPVLPFADTPALNHRLSRPFREEDEEEAGFEADEEGGGDEDISPLTVPISPNADHAQTWLKYQRTDGGAGGSLASWTSAERPLFPPRGAGGRNLTKPEHATTTVHDGPNLKRYNACQGCRRRFHPSEAVSYNGTYFCGDCAATGNAAQTEQQETEEEEEEEAKECQAKEEAEKEEKKILYPYAATTYPPPLRPKQPLSRKPLPIHTHPTELSGSTLRGSASSTPSPPPSAPSSSRSARRRDIPPEYAHLYTPALQPLITPPLPSPSLIHPLSTSLQQQQQQKKQKKKEKEEARKYTTPLPNGTYRRYRTPPAPPPTLFSSIHTTTTTTTDPARREEEEEEEEEAHRRRPPSSIYPSSSSLPPSNLGRLSRVPSSSIMPAIIPTAAYPPPPPLPLPSSSSSTFFNNNNNNNNNKNHMSAYDALHGRKEKRKMGPPVGGRIMRSDTVGSSDTSFRAHVEEEVIDAYADLYGAGGRRSPVSPVSVDGGIGGGGGGDIDHDGEWAWEEGRWDGERVVSAEVEGEGEGREYVGVGWR